MNAVPAISLLLSRADTMARILIIDDEEVKRLLRRDVLKPMGHQITEAKDGHEGLQQYRERPAELVITDIVMPNKDGFEVIRELKEEYPEVRIVVETASDEDGEKGWLELASIFGVHATLQAPFGRDDIIRAVNKALA